MKTFRAVGEDELKTHAKLYLLKPLSKPPKFYSLCEGSIKGHQGEALWKTEYELTEFQKGLSLLRVTKTSKACKLGGLWNTGFRPIGILSYDLNVSHWRRRHICGTVFYRWTRARDKWPDLLCVFFRVSMVDDASSDWRPRWTDCSRSCAHCGSVGFRWRRRAAVWWRRCSTRTTSCSKRRRSSALWSAAWNTSSSNWVRPRPPGSRSTSRIDFVLLLLIYWYFPFSIGVIDF